MNRQGKPKFAPAELWGACSRCGARVRYDSLRRERLTGLLVCSADSGRPVRPCLDPWPPVLDFQVYPDKSIEPPAEPLPARWNLDDIWGTGNNPTPAPDDATRFAALVTSVPYYKTLGQSAAFQFLGPTVAEQVTAVTTIVPADWDGTFVPSGSVRTVFPPASPSSAVNETDVDEVALQLFGPPATAAKGV